MLLTKPFYIRLIAVLLICCSVVVFGQTASEMKRGQMAKKQTLVQIESNSFDALRHEIPLFQLIAHRSSGVVNAEFKEVQRKPLRGVNTDKLDMMKQVSKADIRDQADHENPDLYSAVLLKGSSTFEFYDIATGRSFQMTALKEAMARFSRSISRAPYSSNPTGRPVDNKTLEQEEQTKKAWSKGHDSRLRRAIQDGFSDVHPTYQRLANYGGCSATVLSASPHRMVALTAAHCIFVTGLNGSSFNYSSIDARRNGIGSYADITVGRSPRWGAWRPVGFTFYPQYIDSNCEQEWDIGCAMYDIALVIAEPHPLYPVVSQAPNGMAWAYRPKSWLNGNRRLYRRGYPGCSSYGGGPTNNTHPYNTCSEDTLYGDGAYGIGPLIGLSNDGTYLVMATSSDSSKGDSGSGLYYYDGGHPYVFAVVSSELIGCHEDCTEIFPNYARRIGPVFFDHINYVVNLGVASSQEPNSFGISD